MQDTTMPPLLLIWRQSRELLCLHLYKKMLTSKWILHERQYIVDEVQFLHEPPAQVGEGSSHVLEREAHPLSQPRALDHKFHCPCRFCAPKLTLIHKIRRSILC